MVPPERLAAVIDCTPTTCRGCGHPLRGTDPEPLRHQVAELPEVQPDVVEYRLHRLACRRGAAAERGALPARVPRGAFGPRLRATVALLGGACRLSKRQVQAALADLLGLSVSLGMVSKVERQPAIGWRPLPSPRERRRYRAESNLGDGVPAPAAAAMPANQGMRRVAHTRIVRAVELALFLQRSVNVDGPRTWPAPVRRVPADPGATAVAAA